MVDFERLVAEVLRQRPDLKKDTLLEKVDEKKRTVGAGYLTDQGAVFLVASELGLSLNQVASSDLSLRNLYIGANDITVVGRIFTVYPLKRYLKKDGAQGQYRRLILFDSNTFTQTTLWDDKAKIIDDCKLQPDNPIRIEKGYVKSGLDGQPVLNVGNRGSIELIVNQTITNGLPILKDITKDVSNIIGSEKHLSILGTITSPPKVSEFTRKNGEPGRVIQFYLRSLSNNREIRVAIWNNDSLQLANIQLNSTIRLVNVKSRLAPQGQVELHGDEATFVEVITISPRSLEPRTIEPRVLRILSKGKLQEGSNKRLSISILVSNKTGELFTLIARGEAAKLLQDINNETLIKCNSFESNPSMLICESDSLINSNLKEDPKHPSSSTFTYKINKITNMTTPIFLEVIALSKSSLQDIPIKDGSTVKKAEVVLGDETGEIKLVAWRNLAQVIEGIIPGQKFHINAVLVQKGRDGQPSLQVRSYSSIEKIL